MNPDPYSSFGVTIAPRVHGKNGEWMLHLIYSHILILKNTPKKMQIDLHFEFKTLLDSQNQNPKNSKNHWKHDKDHNIIMKIQI